MPDRRAGTVEPIAAAVQQPEGVAHLHECVELEREQRRILGRVELAGLLRLADTALDQPEPPVHRLDELLPHRARVGVELGGRGGEEAAAGEYRLLQVPEEVLTQRFQPAERRTRGRGRA